MNGGVSCRATPCRPASVQLNRAQLGLRRRRAGFAQQDYARRHFAPALAADHGGFETEHVQTGFVGQPAQVARPMGVARIGTENEAAIRGSTAP